MAPKHRGHILSGHAANISLFVCREFAVNLLPDEVRKTLPVLYSTQDEADPLARVKLFTPWSNWTWFITEYDGADLCFGLVSGHEREFGYFSLREIAEVRGPGGLRIERDLWFTATPASECAPRETAQTMVVWAVFSLRSRGRPPFRHGRQVVVLSTSSSKPALTPAGPLPFPRSGLESS